MLWDIDLIFGMWVYNDKLQIKFMFRSSPMIFGRVMALGLWNLAKYLVVTPFFAMLRDIDLIFGMWVYNDKLQIKFTFRSGPMIFGRVMAVGLWNLAKYLVVTTLFHWFEILTWFLVWECMITSYRSTENSFRLNDFWPTYSCWALKFGQIFSCHHFISLWFEIFTWFLVWGV